MELTSLLQTGKVLMRPQKVSICGKGLTDVNTNPSFTVTEAMLKKKRCNAQKTRFSMIDRRTSPVF